MAETMWVAPPEKDYKAARHQFVELYGSTAVLNTYLLIAVATLSVVSLALVGLNIRTVLALQNYKPPVIRISEAGQAQVLNPDSLEYHPHESELRYFLIRFVTDHYSRMRATVRDNYARSLYFLDGPLANATIEANKKNKALETFLAGSGEEIDVNVRNVSIEDLRQPPYRATVEFEKLYYGAGDRTPSRREQYVANVVFVVKERVPNAIIPVNPLGLTITYFREDQAFQ